MKYFVVFLILVSFSVIAFAEPVPEPESQGNFTAYENCGLGTTLQSGICVVEESQKKTTDSSGKWGTITFPPTLQLSEMITVPLFDNSFSIIEKQVRYDMFYDITNATINDVQLNCESSSFTLSIISNDDGILQLDIPEGMLGGIFMVLVDGKEWDDVSLDGNILTVNFTKDTITIEFLGAYNLSTSVDDGVCDVIHNPPYSYILSPLKQFKSGISFSEIQCKTGFELVEKKTNGHPICIKGTSVKSIFLDIKFDLS